MTKTSNNAEFTEHGHAARQLREQLRGTRKNLTRRMDSAIESLEQARLCLEDGNMPNTCGILQSKATEIEMGIGRLAALTDAFQHIETLIKASETNA